MTTEQFIEQFSALMIDANEAAINNWLNANEPGYECRSDQGVAELISMTENLEDEDYDSAHCHSRSKFRN